VNPDDLTDCIDALLPQTQCRQCGYAGCRPYAEAVGKNEAPINRCPPGGNEVIAELAALLQRPPMPLDTGCGPAKAPAVALIDETWCIGCTLCIQACPVDAIAGAAKLMHTVIAQECTGCELCIPPCPVACIQMVDVARTGAREQRVARATHARARYTARKQRLAAQAQAGRSHRRNDTGIIAEDPRKRSAIERALQRARVRIKNNTLKTNT